MNNYNEEVLYNDFIQMLSKGTIIFYSPTLIDDDLRTNYFILDELQRILKVKNLPTLNVIKDIDKLKEFIKSRIDGKININLIFNGLKSDINEDLEQLLKNDLVNIIYFTYKKYFNDSLKALIENLDYFYNIRKDLECFKNIKFIYANRMYLNDYLSKFNQNNS